MAKYLSVNLYSNENGDGVVHETAKLEQVDTHISISLERMYIAIADGISGRLIIKANGSTLLDAIVSPSKKQQVIALDCVVQRSLKLEFSFLCFNQMETEDPETRGELGESPSPSPIFKIMKLVSLLILVKS